MISFIKDRHGGLGRDSWYLRGNVYPKMALYSIKTYFITILTEFHTYLMI